MADKFPVVNVVKGALAAPLSDTKLLLKSFAILAVVVGIVLSYASSKGLSVDLFQQLSGPNGESLMLEHSAAIGVTYLLAILLFGPTTAYIFNQWVRFGAYGADGIKFPTRGAAVSAALVNMLKFFLIFLLIGIVVVVVIFVMNAIGVGPDLTDVQASSNGDLAAMTANQFITSLVTTLLICIIYSLFSTNLTQTAVKSDKEGLEHPHTMDFTIVLFLLYMVSFIPGTLAGLTGSWVLSLVVSATIGFFVFVSVAVAHGLRFSICVADMPEEDAKSA